MNFTRTVSFPYDENILVSTGQDDSTMKIWEIPTGRLLKTVRMDVPEVRCGCVSPSGKYFAGGSITGQVNIWELSSGKIVHTYNEYRCDVSGISWSADDKLVFSGFQDGTIIALKMIKPDWQIKILRPNQPLPAMEVLVLRT